MPSSTSSKPRARSANASMPTSPTSPRSKTNTSKAHHATNKRPPALFIRWAFVLFLVLALKTRFPTAANPPVPRPCPSFRRDTSQSPACTRSTPTRRPCLWLSRVLLPPPLRLPEPPAALSLSRDKSLPAPYRTAESILSESHPNRAPLSAAPACLHKCRNCRPPARRPQSLRESLPLVPALRPP